MNKLKMLVLTAMAAATVGTGALAAAPSASALPFGDSYCKTLLSMQREAMNDANQSYAVGNFRMGVYYTSLAQQYQTLYDAGC
jgi:hypothetical protein